MGNHPADTSSAYASDGNYGLEVIAAGGGDTDNAIMLDVNEFMTLRNGIDYRLQLYAYTATGTTTLTFACGDITETNVISTVAMTVMNFDFTATTSTTGNIYLYVDKAATFYIDKISLARN